MEVLILILIASTAVAQQFNLLLVNSSSIDSDQVFVEINADQLQLTANVSNNPRFVGEFQHGNVISESNKKFLTVDNHQVKLADNGVNSFTGVDGLLAHENNTLFSVQRVDGHGQAFYIYDDSVPVEDAGFYANLKIVLATNSSKSTANTTVSSKSHVNGSAHSTVDSLSQINGTAVILPPVAPSHANSSNLTYQTHTNVTYQTHSNSTYQTHANLTYQTHANLTRLSTPIIVLPGNRTALLNSTTVPPNSNSIPSTFANSTASDTGQAVATSTPRPNGSISPSFSAPVSQVNEVYKVPPAQIGAVIFIAALSILF